MANRKIKFYHRQPIPQRFYVGVQGEHNITSLTFVNLPAIADGQAAVIYMTLPDGNAVDAHQLVNDSVTLTRTHLQQNGTITAWIVIQSGTEIVWKSEMMYMEVTDVPEFSDAFEEQYPTAFEEAIAQTAEYMNSARSSADVATEAAQNAEVYASRAEGAAVNAADALASVENKLQAAEAAKRDAESAAAAAGRHATNADNSNSAAQEAAINALSAQHAAELAQQGAEAAAEYVSNIEADAVILEPGSPPTATFENGVLMIGIPSIDPESITLRPATRSRLGGIIVGEDLNVTEEGVLSVDKTDNFSEDNTKPITAGAVYTVVGNINALLQTI